MIHMSKVTGSSNNLPTSSGASVSVPASGLSVAAEVGLGVAVGSASVPVLLQPAITPISMTKIISSAMICLFIITPPLFPF